jgi:hypothetical protein
MLEIVRWLVFILLFAGQSTTVDAPPTVIDLAPAPPITPELAAPGDDQVVAVPISLELGATWVYHQEYYAPSNLESRKIVTMTTILTETVVELLHEGAVQRARVHPAREQLFLDPGYSMNADAEDSDFWYILDGNKLYKSIEAGSSSQEGRQFITLLYDFPLTVGKEWCPGNPNFPEDCASAGMRRIIDAGRYATPAGKFEDCYQSHEFYNSGGPYIWFCTGAGVVAETYDHGGTPFGHRKTLINYRIVHP